MFGLHSHAALLAPWAPSVIVILIILVFVAGYGFQRKANDRDDPGPKTREH